MTVTEVGFIHCEALETHVIAPEHPLKHQRLALTRKLIEATGLFDVADVVRRCPPPASTQELELVHDRDYVEVVKALSAGGVVPDMGEFGFGHIDNPPSLGMFEWASLATGVVIDACRLVSSGNLARAFAPGAGVNHHAMRRRASGFGIFNDCGVALAQLAQANKRVVYIDLDCHHGDGVQSLFYASDRVMTISVHESGVALFPGSGFEDEIGESEGRFYSVNVPLPSYTTDAIWLQAIDEVVIPLTRAFAPDMIVTQMGADGHFADPLTHFKLTVQSIWAAAARMSALADELGVGWVAVGGGGYDMAAVARAWLGVWAVVAGQQVPPLLPAYPDLVLGEDRQSVVDKAPALPAELLLHVTEEAEATIRRVKGIFGHRFR